MVSISRWLRVPRPRTFLGIMSLRTGTEMIALSMIFNKVTGFYGLLAILTGFSLSPLQLSMYVYSLAALVVLAFLMPHIRKQSPFQNIAFAWFYLIDTIVNTAFTSAFAVTWVLAVSADNTNTGIPSSAPGSGMIDDTAGFTNPEFNVSKVDILVTPVKGGEVVSLATAAAAGVARAASPSIGDGLGVEETIPSMILVVVMTLIRVYFILVVMAYARQVLRQHIYTTSSTKLHLHTDGAADTPSDNPFAVGSAGGQGWKGKLGRMMVGIGEGYWLGGQADEAWMKNVDGRFRATKAASGPPGTLERERRARSGTGPPAPPANLVKA